MTVDVKKLTNNELQQHLEELRNRAPSKPERKQARRGKRSSVPTAKLTQQELADFVAEMKGLGE